MKKYKIAIAVILILAVGFLSSCSINDEPKEKTAEVQSAEIVKDVSDSESTAEIKEKSPKKPAVPTEEKDIPDMPAEITEEKDKNPKAEETEEKDDNSEKEVTEEKDEPDSNPEPVEPENAVISDKELTCTLSVRCDTILNNMNKLDSEKLDIVPKDGVIFAEKAVTFYEGESVFNVFMREMKQNKIHLEFENTPIYGSAYIEGIANIYEFDCGELSGWMYKVNGWYPNYGCSRYQLKAGDRIEWVYTCDLGKDVGGEYSARNGR